MIPALCFAQGDVLQSFLDNLEKKTLESAFTVTITERASQPVSFTGNIVMRGERFSGKLMGTEMCTNTHRSTQYASRMMTNRSVRVGITCRNLYDTNLAFSRFCFGYMMCTRLSSS